MKPRIMSILGFFDNINKFSPDLDNVVTFCYDNFDIINKYVIRLILSPTKEE